jgi:hypothetical protein
MRNVSVLNVDFECWILDERHPTITPDPSLCKIHNHQSKASTLTGRRYISSPIQVHHSKPPLMLTVLMPVWNGERYLGEAIESILNQTYRDFEFLIIDDGSTDTTNAILAEYAAMDSRIRVLRQEHRGLVATLNHGLSECRTEWVARMDCDDIAYPERLEMQMQALARHPRAVLCHTQVEYFGDARFVTPSARMVTTRALHLLRLCHHCSISHPTVVYRKSAVLEAGGYRTEDLHVEDYSLWGRLIDCGEFIVVKKPLLRLRLHGESISKKEAEIQMSLSAGIANSHCRKFLHLGDSEAARALSVLRAETGHRGLIDWLWVLFHCLPRLECQSFELWIWALWKTFGRVAPQANHQASNK